jgi:hypothetical protein
MNRQGGNKADDTGGDFSGYGRQIRISRDLTRNLIESPGYTLQNARVPHSVKITWMDSGGQKIPGACESSTILYDSGDFFVRSFHVDKYTFIY